MPKDRSDRGAALITVLLFMVLTFILISAMMSVTGNEIFISSVQRDGARALELAQTGINEAIQRIEEGHSYFPFFTSSLVPTMTVTVARPFTGDDSAYLEIKAQATVGRATRRLTALVLQVMRSFPPDITFASNLDVNSVAADISGDVYSRSFIQYKGYPGANTVSYAAWRMSKEAPGAVAFCYTSAQCNAISANANVDRWYAGTRRAANRNSTLGQDILAWAALVNPATCDTTVGGNVLQLGIRAEYEPTPSTGPQIADTFWLYGFDKDDPDGVGGVPSQLDPDLYPCGLPYKYQIDDTLIDEATGAAVVPGRWFKNVIFEQWYDNYWFYSDTKMKLIKRNGGPCIPGDEICLPGNVQPDIDPYNSAGTYDGIGYPQFGTVPPPPAPVNMEDGNYDSKLIPGVNVFDTDGDGYYDVPQAATDWGCKNPEMPGCAVSRPRTVWLAGDTGTNWDFEGGGAGGLKGHGTLVVDGNVRVQGSFEYWGTIVVNEDFDVSGGGTAAIHGGLITQGPLEIAGTIDVEGGVVITSPPVGLSTVLGKAWWER